MTIQPSVALAAVVTLAGCGGQGAAAADASVDASTEDARADAPTGADASMRSDGSGVDADADAAPLETGAADAPSVTPDSGASVDSGAAPDAAACGGCGQGQICCNVLMAGSYQCIHPLTDPLDCGGCNIECGVNEYCGNGVCGTPPCTSSSCTAGLCCGTDCCAHGRICCNTDAGLACVADITCP
jgi:hypothetical protein